MSYQITITKTETVRKVLPKRWETLGTKEVPRDREFYQSSKDEPKTRIDEVRGYTPEVETVQTDTVKVYEQVVQDMDLNAVILAVNGLPHVVKSV